ncbi:hypothetical protein E2562_019723 [Oryza meyeriana var. granulata]|uniref:Uncharacterized protein n=1 Tax=Oryza meyeriana var. granulata TaxID=110450 RepID=A0A6G1C883_9ORYZ|nr:hypothetical protein E2562_019723 [Oryza meyeriana var. granulata]
MGSPRRRNHLTSGCASRHLLSRRRSTPTPMAHAQVRGGGEDGRQPAAGRAPRLSLTIVAGRCGGGAKRGSRTCAAVRCSPALHRLIFAKGKNH